LDVIEFTGSFVDCEIALDIVLETRSSFGVKGVKFFPPVVGFSILFQKLKVTTTGKNVSSTKWRK